MDIQTRRWLAISLVVLFALFSNLLFFGREAKHYASHFPDAELAYYDPWNELQKYRARFGKVRDQLPSGDVVGYVSDTTSPTHYFFTQFVLAPVVLDRNQHRRLVVGNFKKGFIPEAFLTNSQFELVSDFGEGAAIFRHHE